MYGLILNLTSGYMCGILAISRHNENAGDGIYDLTKITKAELLKRPGARFVQAGFINEERCDKMYAHLCEILGKPAYKSPTRINTNMPANNKFFTAIWELEAR